MRNQVTCVLIDVEQTHGRSENQHARTRALFDKSINTNLLKCFTGMNGRMYGICDFHSTTP
ncbi:MAG: hypothetical protein IH803_05895 [Nitrospirae bacterium]|nr:hypothetical protein [Nitrospirota bacterium]